MIDLAQHMQYKPVLYKIDELFLDKGRLLIAIDGRCAAGKTSLAAFLKNTYKCNVIPMDHFFLRNEQRSTERLSEPGNNVDHERVLEEIMMPLMKHEDFVYRPYDCQKRDFGDAINVQSKRINVVEGSYSCHPELFDFYDLRIFLTISPEEQLSRIRERNGADHAEDFIRKWIPYEERYFAAFDIEKRCDFCFGMDLEKETPQ